MGKNPMNKHTSVALTILGILMLIAGIAVILYGSFAVPAEFMGSNMRIILGNQDQTFYPNMLPGAVMCGMAIIVTLVGLIELLPERVLSKSIVS
jgi:hypothetical protein